MKKVISIIVLATLCFFSCGRDEIDTSLNTDEEMSFIGILETEESTENLFENVSLKISKGYYECTTDLPYGYGAGKIELKGNTINFIDTAFFAIPAVYGPAYVLSGSYHYEFIGENLEMWREKNVGRIRYKLKLLE